jgi:hypothetical protein
MDEGGTSVEWEFFRKSNSEKSGKITLKAPHVAPKWFTFLGNIPTWGHLICPVLEKNHVLFF